MTEHISEGRMNGSPVLAVEDLTIALNQGAEPLVDGLSLTVAPGERVGLIGESGSGKSLTALSVMGLLHPSLQATGSVRLSGRQVLGLGEKQLAALRGRHMSMVFQEPMTALDPLMRVGKQVEQVLRTHGTPRATARARVSHLLQEVGLPEPDLLAAAYPHQLSGGQRQRVLIAMAVANNPQLLIADEPTTALDVTVQAQILQLLATLSSQRGSGLLLITHDLAVVAAVCQRVVVMRQGQLVEQGPVDRVFSQPRHPYTQQLLTASRLPAYADAERGDGLPPLISVKDVRKNYPARTLGAPATQALAGVSLDIYPGEALGIVGESGSGKSSLLRLVGAGDTADSGSISYRLPGAGTQLGAGVSGGQVVAAASRAAVRRDMMRVRQAVRMVFQDPASALDPRMTIGQILAEPLLTRFYLTQGPAARQAAVLQAETSSAGASGTGVSDAQAPGQKLLGRRKLGGAGRQPDWVQARVLEMLAAVGLDQPGILSRYPQQFSGGQRQRIAIARALVTHPPIVLADEPVSALDVSVRGQILDVLSQLTRDRGLTLVLVSHDMAVVRHLCDRVAVMRQGQLVEVGATRSLWEHPHHPYTQALKAATLTL